MIFIMRFSTNLFLDEKSNQSALVDCSAFNEEMEKLIGDTELKYILLTHGHYDHIGGVNKVKENLNNLKQDPLFIAVSNRYSQGKTASAGSENNNINLQDKIIYEMAQDIEELINSAYVDNFGSPNTTAEQEVRNN